VQSFTSDISSDGWTGPSSMYVEVGHRPGTIVATLSRPPESPPRLRSTVTVAAAPATVSPFAVKTTRAPYWQRRWTLVGPGSRTFRIPTQGRPTAVDIKVEPTFSPSDYGSPDTRQLGVQAAFRFEPLSTRRARR
jgi:hypothetical protein